MRKNKQRWASAALLPTILFLSGCFDKTDCNDSTSKETALSIITAELSKTVWFETKLAMGDTTILEDIQTSHRSQSGEALSCKANYSFIYNGKPKAFNVDYDLNYLQDKGLAEVSVYLSPLMKQFLNLVRVEPPIKNGEDIRLDPATGNVLAKVYWKNNQLDGVAEAYDPNTFALIAQTHYQNGKKTGIQKNWSPDGQQQWGELDWVNGKATGYEKKFVEGKPVVDIKWQAGLQTGFRSNYQTFGAPYKETNYSDGKILGAVKSYRYNNGRDAYYLAMEEVYDGGDRPSKVSEFNYSNGKLSSEENYNHAGQFNGFVRHYNDDGHIKYEELYQDGVRISYSDHTQ